VGTWHRLTHRHQKWLLSGDGEHCEIIICGSWLTRRCTAWFRPGPGTLWERVTDLPALRQRLGLEPGQQEHPGQERR
jgi:hypothetical protein